MLNLLEQWYNTEIELFEYFPRESIIFSTSTLLYGVSGSGKTTLIASYLLQKPKSTYLYIDCSDKRLDSATIHESLQSFIDDNHISILVLDNFNYNFTIAQCKQIIIASDYLHESFLIPKTFLTIELFTLRYREFQQALSSKQEHLSLFLKYGAFAPLVTRPKQTHHAYLQSIVQSHHPLAQHIASVIANSASNKLSVLQLYERCKQRIKLSKDQLYLAINILQAKGVLYTSQKLNHPKAVKKFFFCDHALFTAFAKQKQFFRLFETVVFNELLKSGEVPYYSDGIDFITHNEAIALKPFSDENMLFSIVETLEALLVSLGLKQLTIITMKSSRNFSHPLFTVRMVSFESWATTLN